MNIFQILLSILLIVSATGCTSIAKKTIRGTGAVAKTTIQGGGAVTKTAVNTALDVASAVFKKGAVTLVEATGVRQTIPWTKGLDLATASQKAKVNTAAKAVEILRGVQKLTATARTLLKPGDIITIK